MSLLIIECIEAFTGGGAYL